MRRWLKIIIPLILLAGGAVLCAIRWQAWFGMPDEPRWNGEKITYVFPQPSTQIPDSITELTFLVLGDIHNKLTRTEYDTLAARVPQANTVIQVGDWLERGQHYYEQLLLREWTNSGLYGLSVIATPGNHEYSKGLKKTVSPIWEDMFPHPFNGPIDVPGSSYYIDFPQVRFIIIDTNPLVRTMYLTRTLTWLRTLQKTAGDRSVVVLMHHPVLSVGKGRANPLIYSTFRHALGEADLVLAGHDHSYMRRAPFVVLNTAGTSKEQKYRYTPEVTDSVPVYGVLTLNTKRSTLNFTVHRLNDGAVIDSLYVKHD